MEATITSQQLHVYEDENLPTVNRIYGNAGFYIHQRFFFEGKKLRQNYTERNKVFVGVAALMYMYIYLHFFSFLYFCFG